jgi:hypothetical protein
MAYVLLVIAWIVANPPFASPDEEAHYLRAVGVSRGDLIGKPARFPGPRRNPQLEFVNKFTRSVTVPSRLSPVGSGCNIAQPQVSSACLYPMNPPRVQTTANTYVGNYAPAAYLLPAALLRSADNPMTADRLARLGVAVPAVLLIAAAIFLLWTPTRDGWSLLGVVIALTPMVLFMGSTMNPNGLEIAAGLAFTAAAVRITRAPDVPGWVWFAAAASGVLLASSRTLGPLWVALAVALGISLIGMREAWRTTRTVRALLAGMAVLAAVVLNLAWEQAHGADVDFALDSLQEGISVGVASLPAVLTEAIGAFGYLEVRLPSPAYFAWWGSALALVTLALVVGAARERRTLVAALVVTMVVPVALYAAVFRPTGFGVQGRYILPFAVAVPVLAGEIVFRHRERLKLLNSRRLLAWFAAVAAAVHALAWYVNARRYATGVDGPLWFFGSEEWSPPLGWWPWALLAGLGATLLVIAGAVDLQSRWRRTGRTGVTTL